MEEELREKMNRPNIHYGTDIERETKRFLFVGIVSLFILVILAVMV